MTDPQRFFARAEALLDRLERLLPVEPQAPDWAAATAFRWRNRSGRGEVLAVAYPSKVRLADLQCIDRPKQAMDQNTRQFLAGLPANNALLWGPRGTGKSSLIKALLNEYADQGLRLIEVEKEHLVDLPEIVEHLYDRPEHFIVFCDDLSFEANEPGYKALKVVLDGSINSTPDNVLIYATSNRRHLLPEYRDENLDARNVEGEIHFGDVIEEKVSLSERFGLWLAFHPFSQEGYLSIVDYWLERLGVAEREGDEVRRAALQWALLHGSRSGRSAWQFARDWAGRIRLQQRGREDRD